MNKLMMVVASEAFGSISTASLADGGNFFVNADAGQADYRAGSTYSMPAYTLYIGSNTDKKDSAGALRFGYRWHSAVDFGVETGYVDLGQSERTLPGFANNYYTNELKIRGWLLGGNLNYNINDSWYVSARGGWFRSQVESEGTGVMTAPPLTYTGLKNYNFSSTGTGEYVGVGAGYNLSSNFSIGLSYDNCHAHPISNGTGTGVNVALYSVSAEYRF